MVRGKRMDARFISLTGLLLAAAIIFPFVFHQFGIAGQIFLPMHIPVFLAGLVLGPWAGFLVGALSPGLSALLTGMPTAAMALAMTPELVVYGLVSGVVYRGTNGSLWISLLAAMILGRAMGCLTAVFIAPLLGFQVRTVEAVLAVMVLGWPGVIIQLLILPPVVVKVRRALIA